MFYQWRNLYPAKYNTGSQMVIDMIEDRIEYTYKRKSRNPSQGQISSKQTVDFKIKTELPDDFL